MTYDLEERLLAFASDIVRIRETLPDTRSGNHVAKQLLRSGTSALPNHGEAQAAESQKDFVHKLRICLKELRETLRWLKLIRKAGLIGHAENLLPLMRETDELIRIFVSSIRTAERNL